MIETSYHLIGGCGKYQIIVTFLVFLSQINTSCNILSPIFVNNEQHISCITHNSSKSLIYNKHNCSFNEIIENCKSLNVLPEPMTHTIRMDFGLLCEYSHLTSITTLSFMIGIFLGSLFGGFFNDRFGRKLGCMTSYLSLGVFSLLAAASPYFWLYCLARLMLGLSCSFSFVSNSGMVLEITEIKQRTAFGFIWNLGYDFGYIVLVMMAYLIRNSTTLQYSITGIAAVSTIFSFYYVESFRWLLAKGRYKEAKKVMLHMIKVNKTQTEESKIDDFINLYIKEKDLMKVPKISVKEVFRYKIVLVNLLCTWFLFFCVSFSYYTFILGSSKISSKLYFSTIISATAAFVLRIIYMFLAYKVPRTYLLISLQMSLFVSFVASLLLKYLLGNKNIYSTILLTLSVGFSGTNFGFMWIYGGEAFPTVIRSSSVAIGSAFARISGMLSTQMQIVFDLAPYALPILGAIMAGVGTLMAIFILPETFNLPSTDFLEQANISFKQRRQFWRARQRKLSRSAIPEEIEIKLETSNTIN